MRRVFRTCSCGKTTVNKYGNCVRCRKEMDEYAKYLERQREKELQTSSQRYHGTDRDDR